MDLAAEVVPPSLGGLLGPLGADERLAARVERLRARLLHLETHARVSGAALELCAYLGVTARVGESVPADVALVAGHVDVSPKDILDVLLGGAVLLGPGDGLGKGAQPGKVHLGGEFPEEDPTLVLVPGEGLE